MMDNFGPTSFVIDNNDKETKHNSNSCYYVSDLLFLNSSLLLSPDVIEIQIKFYSSVFR